MGFLYGWYKHLCVSKLNNEYFTRKKTFKTVSWLSKSYIHGSLLQSLREHGGFFKTGISKGSVVSVCLYVCLLVTTVNCAKTDKPLV